MSATRDVRVHLVQREEDIPPFTGLDAMTRFFHDNMKPWHDTPADVRRGIEYAFSDEEGKGGFVLIAEMEATMVGGLVMLDTGMGGYVPRNLLLFVAVRPDLRGRGIGGLLVERGLEACEGAVKLHVEYDNPAKRLYERIGFQSKYAEMRYTP